MKSFLFVTDLDHTLVGERRALAVLNEKLQQHREEHGTKIVYATGRSPILFAELQSQQQLIEPDALVASVGTEIYFKGSDTADNGWSDKLSPGWNREHILATTAHFADLVMQPDSEQRPYKVSFLLTEDSAQEVLPQLKLYLQQQGLDTKLIYSAGVDLDILPRHGDKGLAVQYLRSLWDIEAQQTVVCGDSGNDISLFSQTEERGIIVGNAKSELLQWHNENGADYHYLAQAFCAGGILEGLNHFGFIE
ncbi:sucrose-phosphate phosphatase [Synechocystis sp. PCC 7509]|uniref:sucrose-phosphate phosphatase n=1 Tax=Synechocystis sp. PCC 7509 TaxID=927677 RepID=UPI0002ACBC65|nr:sucrose-phosphate phosphatase [Synechocystis sp. PCC 7509]